MTRILLKPDTLDEENRKFAQVRLPRPLFLNSVPKSGSHLLRNIMRMFVAPDQHWRREYIQHAILGRYGAEAFSASKPMISWGHMLFSDESAVALRDVRHIVLVRDPYDWVLARAIADQRHHCRPTRHQVLPHQRRGGGRAQRRQDGHFRHQHGIAGRHIGKNPSIGRVVIDDQHLERHRAPLPATGTSMRTR